MNFKHSLTKALMLFCMALLFAPTAGAAGKPKKVERDYPVYPASPKQQTWELADEKSAGCVSCHTASDQKTMHTNPGVVLGCVDCHGGQAKVWKPEGAHKGDTAYFEAMELAHVLPTYPSVWHYSSLKDKHAKNADHSSGTHDDEHDSSPKKQHHGPRHTSANPERSYSWLNAESPEFTRFINPGDYRIAREACGACHMEIIQNSERSLMSTNAMFFGGASYNNGILPFKQYILGEAYTREGEAAAIQGPVLEQPEAAMIEYGILPGLAPLPAWETTRPGDIFRVFERGGRNLLNLFPETGIPNSLGLIQRLEEPGRPDFRQSNRGPGTGGRISVPILNIHKTRLNDPLAWFIGTNDQPGDYRHSGCSGCHVVYANDRDPKHSAQYAKFGHTGETQTKDPTIPKGEPGHPLEHSFTRAIPTSQCMTCHMHQPNMFMNTYLGYTMWDYESDAPAMWPEQQAYPSHAEMRDKLDRNPEGAVVRGKWGDPEFLKGVSELNPTLNDTQFADYHGHGWNFRAVFKRDRDGNLLDDAGFEVANDDPEKFSKAVHMSSIHLDKGMHCVDCHFEQDMHGNGHIYGEVGAAVEIDCRDCHGSTKKYPPLRTSGTAAPPSGNDLSLLRNPDGKKRFQWIDGKLIQRSVVTPGLEWEVSLVKDSVTPGNAEYNPKSAQAKLMRKDPSTQNWDPLSADESSSALAHGDDDMECFACHTSWTTSCGGCHLPIEANWKTERHRYEPGESRNYATYNPQVARDQLFMLGKHGPVTGGRTAPVRSTSALVLSSTNANREKIYVQQPPISSSGYSSQAMNPHFPHTTRLEETKTCVDCHLSPENDNNAIIAQLLGLGTNYLNFMGYHAYVGGEGELNAIQVTEWEEPQAVIGSYLHKYAYPDWYLNHQVADKQLETAHNHSSGTIGCLQLRGEYLFTAAGKKGFFAYDVASVANKGISQRIVSQPFGPLGKNGHRTRIKSKNATCVALASNQPVDPERNTGKLMRELNLEQPHHDVYRYAFITDSKEGLIVTHIGTLHDGELRNNKLRRALTWNPKGVLDGARHITLAGHRAYIAADQGLVIVNLDKPLEPKVENILPFNDVRGTAVQFRYLWVTDATGLHVVDITKPTQPKLLPASSLPLANAQRVYLARTWAYVAAGEQGLAIIDVKNPERPELQQLFNADGQIIDARDVKVAATNASLFAYIADGIGGLKVVQLIAPDTQPNFYGFSPEPKPQLIAKYPTKQPALALSEALHRDRAVDETGGQIAVFGRLGSRPFNLQEMWDFYLNADGTPWKVKPELARSWRADGK